MFTKLFLQTTDPKLNWNTFFSKEIMPRILISILFHTIVYVVVLNTANYIFTNRPLSKEINIRLSLSLFVIMFFGYIGRLLHSKETLTDFSNDYEKTRNYLQQHYNSWIFLG